MKSQILISLAEEKIAELKNLYSGELRNGGSDSLFKHYCSRFWRTTIGDTPASKLHLTHGTIPETISFLKEGHIDVGVVRMPIVDD